jgi:hypothetical protein
MVYLVPVGRRHHELYSESPEETPAPRPGAGRLQRWADRANVQWHTLVEQARLRRSGGRLAGGATAGLPPGRASPSSARSGRSARASPRASCTRRRSMRSRRAELRRIVAAARVITACG